ncbi:MAG: cation:dicarboxylase symporter family transporter, partial [Selenomonadaceae bacterium]|nr:cation:dicarboxylase symporter family transporter [Selenomonadaceae bacterium]
MGVSLAMLIVTTIVSVGTSVLFFQSDLSYMQFAIIGNADYTAPPDYSLSQLFFTLVPPNLVIPFEGQNILQVMFLALFFGLVIKKTIDPMPPLIDGIETFNKFFLSALSLVIPFVPAIVFLAMFSLTATADLNALLALAKI